MGRTKLLVLSFCVNRDIGVGSKGGQDFLQMGQMSDFSDLICSTFWLSNLIWKRLFLSYLGQIWSALEPRLPCLCVKIIVSSFVHFSTRKAGESECWCVDLNGKEIEGTKQESGFLPDCEEGKRINFFWSEATMK